LLRQAADREKVLIGELRHRVRNILSVVQALVSRTLAEASIAESHQAQVAGRLQALADAHDLLVNSDWQGVSIAKIIKTELKPFGDRIEIDGEDLMLQASAVQSLALVIHELTTNAAKHGAFANGSGKVRVSWAVKGSDGNARLHFLWQERGGPPAKIPLREGLGSKLLKTAMRSEGGEPHLIYGEEGLTYQFEVPVSALLAATGSQSAA